MYKMDSNEAHGSLKVENYSNALTLSGCFITEALKILFMGMNHSSTFGRYFFMLHFYAKDTFYILDFSMNACI